MIFLKFTLLFTQSVCFERKIDILFENAINLQLAKSENEESNTNRIEMVVAAESRFLISVSLCQSGCWCVFLLNYDYFYNNYFNKRLPAVVLTLLLLLFVFTAKKYLPICRCFLSLLNRMKSNPGVEG